MDTLLKDVKHSLRMFLRNPGFTLAAVAALALGIGANTAIFSVINTVLLKPLEYPEPESIVQMLSTTPTGSFPGASVTKFNLWRAQTSVLQDVSAYDDGRAGVNITGGAYPEQIRAIHVSVNYFRLFGAGFIAGRSFTAEEDRPHGGRNVILSYGLWQRRFGGDRGVVGKTVDLSGEPYLILGVVGPDFHSDPVADAWLPFQFDPNSTDQAHYFSAAARLKPGVTLDRANAQMKLAGDEFRRRYPLANSQQSFGVKPLQDQVVGDARTSLLVLGGAVSLVLLIACANVANLLLVRASGRRREIAIRAAVGAGRGRIMRQLLTESVLLFLIGGMAGLVLGMISVHALLALNPGNIPRIGEHGAAVTLDWRVFAFTIAVSMLTGVIFGLIPAMGVSRSDLSSGLKESSGRSGTGLRQNKARSLLVVSEMALAIILLIGAALLIRTFVALRTVNPGFNPRNVLTMRISLSEPRFQKSAGVGDMLKNASERIQALPGVVAAAGACCLPLEGGFGLPFIIAGRPLANGDSAHGGSTYTPVSAGFFETFQIPILKGRYFNVRDDGAALPVAIINQSMARRYWPKADPLADRLIIGKNVGPEFADSPRQIIGIVGDIRDGGLNRDPQPEIYIPLAQVPDGITALNARIAPMIFLVRTQGDPHTLSHSIEKELERASDGLPVARIRTMDEVVVQSTARADFNMLLLTIFGGAALVLAAIGIYGLTAYSVQQRTAEIGIRMALGAASSDVRRMILMQGMRLVWVGAVIGLAAAFGLSRLIATFLFGVKASDPMVFTTVPVVLSLVALFAIWFPALRATRIAPSEALRYE
ncbi:MAG TPA: ABC transporter permease [Bryobacteraceae bacterium]